MLKSCDFSYDGKLKAPPRHLIVAGFLLAQAAIAEAESRFLVITGKSRKFSPN
jgi:hypothetical protein